MESESSFSMTEPSENSKRTAVTLPKSEKVC